MGMLEIILHNFPRIFITSVLASVVLYGFFTAYVFTLWNQHFSGTRVTRRHKTSPSNKNPPDIKSFEDNKERTLTNAKYHANFDTCELLQNLENTENTKKENTLFRDRAARLGSLTPGNHFRQSVMNSLTDDIAEELDMDHIYVTFPEFLWMHTFVGPCAYFLWMKGCLILQLRQKLLKKGWIKKKPLNVEKLIATLLLEQTQAIHYYAKTQEDNIAGFFFADFPYVENEGCTYKVADLFAVDIDLDKKVFVKAKLDDKNLTASETLTLVWFNTIAAQHVKLHALANWGVNPAPEVKPINPQLHRNSIITILYNYFGFTCFKGYFDTWKSMGLLSEGWNPETFIECFKHGIRDNIWQHPNIEELAKYSRFVTFIVKTRAVFISEFAKYKDDFPGVHGEAMFVGTVLHSLDHSLMDWNLQDPLWLDVDHPRFGMMAEIGRVVKVGFVSDLPFIMFSKRFKDHGHPFYESVYKKAAKFDKLLADTMDTCIIK